MPQMEHPGILSGVPVPRQAESTPYRTPQSHAREEGGGHGVKRTSIAASPYD